MNKLTMAALGLSLMIGSAFAAAPQADNSKMADQTTAPVAKAKKHKKHAKKGAATTTTTAPAAPTK